jgi:hypothetical protein
MSFQAASFVISTEWFILFFCFSDSCSDRKKRDDSAQTVYSPNGSEIEDSYSVTVGPIRNLQPVNCYGYHVAAIQFLCWQFAEACHIVFFPANGDCFLCVHFVSFCLFSSSVTDSPPDASQRFGIQDSGQDMP